MRSAPSKSASRPLFLLLASLASPAVLGQPPVVEQGPLTLQEALLEAHRANAQLPVAEFQVQQAMARLRQTRGLLYPQLSVDGDVHGGTPQTYASSDALARVLAKTPIYNGGELRAGVARSSAEVDSSIAGYRMSTRDLDHAVRLAYGRILRAEATLDFRRPAIDRLQAYLSVVQSRQAAGQGVGADLLQTLQRLAAARADLEAAGRDLDEGRLALNDLLGREPGAQISLAPLPDPTPPAKTTGTPWLSTPDVEQSEANVRASEASVNAARAGRKPHITFEGDVGTQPVLGSNVALLNNGTGSGAEVTINFSLPFWDSGVLRGRMDEANAVLRQARQQSLVVQREAQLAWTQAVTDLGDLYDEYRARDAATGTARDAYLQAESLYRGGQGTALAVLDAYDAWIQANQSLLDVVYTYRVAQADLYRWGSQ